jgi:RNA polymerase sigma factor (sigma-70 family)
MSRFRAVVQKTSPDQAAHRLPQATSTSAHLRASTPADDDFERLYEENLATLVSIAVSKFRVPLGDAEALAHEVFVSYMRRADVIRDPHAWFLSAICNASRYYWRQNGRNLQHLDEEVANAQPDPVSLDILNGLPDRIAAGEILDNLPPRYQYILRLRYFEGFSIREIAEHLGVTAKYTQKLVAKCLRRAEQQFAPHTERMPNRRSQGEVDEVLAGFVDAYRKVR